MHNHTLDSKDQSANGLGKSKHKGEGEGNAGEGTASATIGIGVTKDPSDLRLVRVKNALAHCGAATDVKAAEEALGHQLDGVVVDKVDAHLISASLSKLRCTCEVKRGEREGRG